MKNEKKIILIVTIIVALLPTIIRFISTGWLGLFGLISIVIFGTMHVFFIYDIAKYYDELIRSDKVSAWIGALLYPFIFLFQFDFGDQPGSFYVYEFFVGRSNSEFEKYAYFIAILASLLYIFHFIRWRIIIKTYSR